MNTTETTPKTSTDTQVETRPRSRRRTGIAVAVAMFVGLLASVFAGAAPAQAAGNSSTGIYFCTSLANHPVNLQIYTNSGWQNYKPGNSGANGCGTFRYVDSGWYYRVTMASSYNSGWCGTSYTVTHASTYAQSQLNRIMSVGNVNQYVGHYYWC